MRLYLDNNKLVILSLIYFIVFFCDLRLEFVLLMMVVVSCPYPLTAHSIQPSIPPSTVSIIKVTFIKLCTKQNFEKQVCPNSTIGNSDR